MSRRWGFGGGEGGHWAVGHVPSRLTVLLDSLLSKHRIDLRARRKQRELISKQFLPQLNPVIAHLAGLRVASKGASEEQDVRLRPAPKGGNSRRVHRGALYAAIFTPARSALLWRGL